MAVGFAGDGKAKTEVPLAELWNGYAWSIRPTPMPIGGAQLNGVSCTSPTQCIAVGYSIPMTGNNTYYRPLIEAWNGANWTIQSAQVPSGPGQGALMSVSCVSPTACTAVGYTVFLAQAVPLIEHWNGATWSIQATPSMTFGQLTGVSCPSLTDCIAVGAGSNDLAESWDAHSWSIQTPPNDGGLNAVSCTSPTACAAVGRRSPILGAIAQGWNGSAWVTQNTPEPSFSNDDDLNAVSCSLAVACTAVGIRDIGPVGTGPLAEAWDGNSWAMQATPNALGASLNGVACTSSTTCTAVGSLTTSSTTGLLLPLVERHS